MKIDQWEFIFIIIRIRRQMQTSVLTRGVIITARQKSYIEKKVSRLNKYLKNEKPITVTVQLIDDSGPNKSGVTQTVKIDVTSPNIALHVEEKKNNIMKAFARAMLSTERQVRDQHKQEIQKSRKGGRLDKVFGILGKFRRRR